MMVDLEGLASLTGSTILGFLHDEDVDANDGYERIFIALTGGWVLAICVYAKRPKREETDKFVDSMSETGAVNVPSDGWTDDYTRSFVGTDTLKNRLYYLLAGNHDRANVVGLYNMASDESAQEELLDGFGPKVRSWYENLRQTA